MNVVGFCRQCDCRPCQCHEHRQFGEVPHGTTVISHNHTEPTRHEGPPNSIVRQLWCLWTVKWSHFDVWALTYPRTNSPDEIQSTTTKFDGINPMFCLHETDEPCYAASRVLWICSTAHILTKKSFEKISWASFGGYFLRKRYGYTMHFGGAYTIPLRVLENL